MPQQTGRYVLVRCRQCGECFPVLFAGQKQAKWCPSCRGEKKRQADRKRRAGVGPGWDRDILAERMQRQAMIKADRERKAKERKARQIRRARADLEYRALHTPVKTELRGRAIVEKRGHCPIAPWPGGKSIFG